MDTVKFVYTVEAVVTRKEYVKERTVLCPSRNYKIPVYTTKKIPEKFIVEVTYLSDDGTVMTTLNNKEIYVNFDRGDALYMNYYASTDRAKKELRYERAKGVE